MGHTGHGVESLLFHLIGVRLGGNLAVLINSVGERVCDMIAIGSHTEAPVKRGAVSVPREMQSSVPVPVMLEGNNTICVVSGRTFVGSNKVKGLGFSGIPICIWRLDNIAAA